MCNIINISMKKPRKGFSVLEVVLVLAIAGLIFAMAFVALPALQRSQRNTQRKSNVSHIIAAMNQWKVRNKGSVSDNASKAYNKVNGFCTFWNRYVGEELQDPSTGQPYKIALWNDTKVFDCRARKTYARSGYDPSAVGRTSGNKWPLMELGDIQYNDVSRCSGDIFDDNLGASANRHMFAFRIYLEGGVIACVDNGFGGDPNDHPNSSSAFFDIFATIEKYQIDSW